MPPFYKQVINFITEMWDVVRYTIRTRKSIKVPAEIQQQRWASCTNCEFLKNSRCTQCGCFMKVKVQLASAKCPISRWNSLDDVYIDDCEICPP